MSEEPDKQVVGDLEDSNRPPKTYQVSIDKVHYVLADPTPTGRELLTKANKLPVEQFALYIKPPGGQPRRVQLDETVDLRVPGVERFVTLPLDQTEGLSEPRRHFTLPAEDMEWLDARAQPYELVLENGAMRVIVHGIATPTGYSVETVTANVRIDPGYPDSQIDMVYFHPALSLASGRAIGSICEEPFDGKSWQRWSRHRTAANPWRPGVDSLATHFALIDEWLEREVRKT